MSRSLSLAVAFVFLAGSLGAIAAPGLKEKEDKSDVKKLQGEWVIESWTQFGQAINTNQWTWTFKDDKYTFDQKSNLEEGSVKIDQAKKPATIDLTITGGNCKGNEQPGIYKIEGDTLTLCLAWPGNTDRPTDFTSTAAQRWILITLKRTKKGD